MKLSEWLAANNMRLTDFARAVGRSASTVHGWKTGRRFPGGRAIAEIERLTGGEVKVQDFISVGELPQQVVP